MQFLHLMEMWPTAWFAFFFNELYGQSQRTAHEDSLDGPAFLCVGWQRRNLLAVNLFKHGAPECTGVNRAIEARLFSGMCVNGP